MAKFRDPFSGMEFDFGNAQEFHFETGGRSYGQRNMSEKDKEKYKEYVKSRMKSHAYQAYKNGSPISNNIMAWRWEEISIDELCADIPNAPKPKFWNQVYYYVQSESDSRDYLIKQEFPLLVFYNHIDNCFIYLRSDGKLMTEKNLFLTEDEALEAIKKKEEENAKTTTIQIVDSDYNLDKKQRIQAWRILYGI